MSEMKETSRLINDGWRFVKMPSGSTLQEAEAAEWRRVDLPHDWLIWQAEDLYETADAWYRRTLTPEETEAPVVILRFDGVYMDCDVLLNGERVCSHAYGYTAFDADLTGRLREGSNELTVHIRHQSPNSRWYSGSGIFRDVTLLRLPEAHLVPDGLYVCPRRRGETWEVDLAAETTGSETLRCTLRDPDGRTVAEGCFGPGEGTVRGTLRLKEAGQLWSPSRPALYTLECAYGSQEIRCRVGLRETVFDPDTGFWLNGEQMKMHGVCMHHDLGALGAAFHEKAARRQLRIMKEMGVNAIRTSHNPPAARYLDLCDEMGLLVVDEAFDMWERSKTEFDYARFFPEQEEADVARWVRRDRNHPCVVLWSIGNEIYDMHADARGVEWTRILRDQVERHDPAGNARVTFGSNYMPWEGAQKCAEALPLPGYNYGEMLYEEHHRLHPDWVIYGSETSSMLSSRGIYHFPASQPILSDADLQCSSLGNSTSSWGAKDLGACIVNDLNTPFTLGQYLWSGFDYIGEPTPYQTRSCYFGQADTAGFPKDSYYLIQSLWADRRMIHIGVTWDWNPGQLIDVRVMTGCAAAELFVNGRSLGRQEINQRDPKRCLAAWQVPFEAGELLAVGYDETGREICRELRQTPGEPASLCVEAEDEFLRADGQDLTFLTVSVRDAAGRPVENARNRVQVRISGGARLMGMDNGDPTDPDGYKVSSKRLFSGKLLLIVGSNGRAEDARISLNTTDGLQTEYLLPVRPARILPGTSCLETIPEPASGEEGTVPLRRIEIRPEAGTEMDPAHPEIAFTWEKIPGNSALNYLKWEVTNEAGIPTPAVELREEGNRILLRGRGDGSYYLRALCGSAADHPEQISQREVRVLGMGTAGLDPYEFVSAGLYDLSSGEIGSGNEKGIAFARFGRSMVGFTQVEFGRAGSDRLTLPIFALDGSRYEIEMYLGNPEQGGRLLTRLSYQKPSIWNVYQEETWTLPEVLRGTQTICFAMTEKVHLKGFRFERQSRAWQAQRACDADTVYGDSFDRAGSAVVNIGNNVTLLWEDMDFGDRETVGLTLEGRTPLQSNAITLRTENDAGETVTDLIPFRGDRRETQTFRVKVCGGKARVSFIFLPGSRFDLYGFRFFRE